MSASIEALARHREIVARFAQTGSWWSAADRNLIVEETRTAPDCQLCRDRSAALSPTAVTGEHDNTGRLPPIAVEVIHAVRNDSGRLTRRWFDHVIDMGMQEEAYVELVAVVASSVVIDTYSQGRNREFLDLDVSAKGFPDFVRSNDVVDVGAWLPIAARGVSDSTAHITRSLGLVPSALALFFDTFEPSYYMQEGKAFSLDHDQVELVASRVSTVNQCFY